jgi:cytoskeletal protein RodZ
MGEASRGVARVGILGLKSEDHMKHLRFRKGHFGLSRRKRGSVFLVILVLLALISSSAIFAQRERNKSEPTLLHREEETPRFAPASLSTGNPVNKAQEGEVSPASLTPSTPSKEYIHIGGKLVATEEPAP